MPAPLEGSNGIQLNPKTKPTTTKMKLVISQVLTEKLDNVTYQSDRAAVLTKEIADTVKLRLKECNFPRFKYVVQVVIGEQRGEGVRRAIANVETLESRLLELQNALAADNINRVFQDTFSFVLLAINGEMNATMDKFRARCSMIDPVTKNPRFGPKMMAKVKDMLRRYDNVKLAIQEDTPLRLQIETKLNDLKQHEEEAKEAEAIRKKEAEEDQRAAERAAEQDGKRLEEEAQEREILRRRQEELRIQRLAVAAQKKREQRERERLEEEQQRQEEQKKRELLNASISPGKKGLELAIDLLRESTGSEALFRQSVEKLLAVVNNICKSPDNTAFRQIPKDNMHFHADLGQFTGGYQCLLALGFKEMQQGDENEPRFVFVMEEPDLSEDLDAWSTWFDGLKEMQNFVESKL